MSESNHYVHYYGGIDPSLYLTVDESFENLSCCCMQEQNQLDLDNKSLNISESLDISGTTTAVENESLYFPSEGAENVLDKRMKVSSEQIETVDILNESLNISRTTTAVENEILYFPSEGAENLLGGRVKDSSEQIEALEKDMAPHRAVDGIDYFPMMDNEQMNMLRENPNLNSMNTSETNDHDISDFCNRNIDIICSADNNDKIDTCDELLDKNCNKDTFNEIRMIEDCAVDDLQPSINSTMSFDEMNMCSTSSSSSRISPYLSLPPLSLSSSSANEHSDSYYENNELFAQSPCLSPTGLEKLSMISSKTENKDEIDECYITRYEFERRRTLSQDKDGDTNLHIFIAKEEEKYNTQYCLVLIPYVAKGPKGLDTVNNMGQTALHLASYTNNTTTTKCLLRYGANSLVLDKEGNSALHIACSNNFLELAKCILETEKDNDKERAETLLNLTNADGLAAMHIAAKNANDQLLYILYEHGANVDIPDDCSKKTPLMFASESAKTETARLLVERLYADVNILSASDSSAMHFAAEANCSDIIKILVQNGAHVGQKTVFLKTEKDLATEKNVKSLLDRSVKKQKRQTVPS